MKIESIQLAVDNIAKYGDTDIFPYPIEKLIFFDKRNEIISLLQELDKNFSNEIVSNPPVNISALAQQLDIQDLDGLHKLIHFGMLIFFQQ